MRFSAAPRSIRILTIELQIIFRSTSKKDLARNLGAFQIVVRRRYAPAYDKMLNEVNLPPPAA
jgi:hypothetical protein